MLLPFTFTSAFSLTISLRLAHTLTLLLFLLLFLLSLLLLPSAITAPTCISTYVVICLHVLFVYCRARSCSRPPASMAPMPLAHSALKCYRSLQRTATSSCLTHEPPKASVGISAIVRPPHKSHQAGTGSILPNRGNGAWHGCGSTKLYRHLSGYSTWYK